ncbi:N-acetyltransferase [Reyranella sp.]|uniref:GNAT family N-acetyltransferase n=1 Tax=Reyranella sp. TaxID=1929291 RepID=UPI002722C4CD|nr:GNAT family N-acetyltransferase [Reyranella sp.]MDO8974952.1 GNAT family N-acetyltransferase [Reyranella sp.]
MTDIDFEIALTDAPPADMRDELGKGLRAFNTALLGPIDGAPLAITIRSRDGTLLGGLYGRTGFRRMFVELLFIPESLRGRGLGSKLLQQAEAEAKRRNCIGAWLETFSAEARRVYERNGYRVFGEIPDYPPGNTRYFLSKDF